MDREERTAPASVARRTRLRPTAVGLIAGLAVVAFALAGAVAVESVNRTTERQLLEQKAEEIGAVLSTAISNVQVPLAAAAEVVAFSDGNADAFAAAMAVPLQRNQFLGAALIDPSGAVVSTTGEALALSNIPERLVAAAAKARGAEGLAVIDTLDLDERVLGYAHASSSDDGWVIYTESRLPARTGAPRSAVFEELDFSLYIGPERVTPALIYTSAPRVPLQGKVAQTTVPFGDEELTLAISTEENLAGDFFARLPWLLGLSGVLLAALVAIAVRAIVRGRQRAEVLAAELAVANHEQRHVISTLQQSLLPRTLPEPQGADLASAFWPSDTSLEVGGDFYDAFQIEANSWAVAIGDVCGKGVDAAALTAAMRHTLRAGAHQLTQPADVLTWARDAVVAFDDTTFCTAAFAFFRATPVGLRVDLALAGHPRPVWISHHGAACIGETGTILGMVPPRFKASTHHLSAGDLLVLYTDGVTDAPGSAGMSEAELCALLADDHGAHPDDVIARVRSELTRRRPDGNHDDIAIVVVRADAEGTSDTGSDEAPLTHAGSTPG